MPTVDPREWARAGRRPPAPSPRLEEAEETVPAKAGPPAVAGDPALATSIFPGSAGRNAGLDRGGNCFGLRQTTSDLTDAKPKQRPTRQQ